MKSIFKVQCISTNCGYYNDLKVGEWYNVTEINDKYGYFRLYELDYSYPKKLFRTVEIRRDQKLSRLFN
jgi:hypothetical protein